MLISHSDPPTPEELYKRRFDKAMKTAKHLYERTDLFVKDISKSKLKPSDKEKVLQMVYKNGKQ